MRLVEDDRVVLGQHAPARGDVGEVEGVVDDHELRLGGARACGLCEAARDERASPPGAAIGSDRQLGPERRRRLDHELRAIARLGRAEPPLHRRVCGAVTPLGIERRLEALQLTAAEVVLPSLQQLDAHGPPADGGGHRHVRAQQLLLERLGRRRDHDPLPGLKRGDQIGEALAHAGAGLGDEVLAAPERTVDGGRERGLLGARLVARQRAGEGAAGAEHVVHRQTTSLRVRTDVLPGRRRSVTNLPANCDIAAGGPLTAPPGRG